MLPKNFLTPRLAEIMHRIPSCSILCDIGTDHAYIPIAAVDSGRVRRAYATDVHQGPVKRAQENIALYGFSKQIEVRLGNGLFPVLDTSAEVVVVAGMGGCLITEILSQCTGFVSGCKCLLLQPMRETDVVRRYLFEQGWSFEETLAQEDRRIYHVLIVHPQKPFGAVTITDWDFRFGTCWLDKHPLFVEELKQLIDERKRIEAGIVTDKAQSLERKENCRIEREYLQKVVEQHETI